MVIDFHVHVFPANIAARTIEKLEAIAGYPAATDGTFEDTEKILSLAGIDGCVLMNVATKPSQQRTINDTAAALQGKGVYSFGALHPLADDIEDEAVRILSLGLHGVKMHPDYQNFFVDDPDFFDICGVLSDLGLPLMLHAGWDPMSPSLVHAPPFRIAKLLDNFPHLTVIAAHLGGMKLYAQVEEHLAGRNIFFDTSMASVYCPPETFARIVSLHGADNILFASDCPWSDPSSSLEYIERARLSSGDTDKILYKNALHLLGAT